MKKALIIANAASMIILFNEENMRILREAGYEVHVACNFKHGSTTSDEVVAERKKSWEEQGIVCHQIDFLRTPFSPKSFDIYKQTKKLIRENHFDIIHCHTPIVSVFARLAARKVRKKGTKVFYTAHGFHFYTGASIFNWLTYYVLEKWLAPVTDTLITINLEDFERAKKKFKAKEILYINGIGVPTEKIANTEIDREAYRTEIGVGNNDLMLFSIGELCNRKNHKTIIKALGEIEDKNVHYVIAGKGGLEEELKELVKSMNLGDRVHFLGFRKDVYALLKACDIFCFPSYQEGLPVALMEAMAAGCPCVVSKIRGNIDLIDEGKGGFLYHPDDVSGFANGIKKFVADHELVKKISHYNLEKIKDFDCKVISNRIKDSYFSVEKSDFVPKINQDMGVGV